MESATLLRVPVGPGVGAGVVGFGVGDALGVSVGAGLGLFVGPELGNCDGTGDGAGVGDDEMVGFSVDVVGCAALVSPLGSVQWGVWWLAD